MLPHGTGSSLTAAAGYKDCRVGNAKEEAKRLIDRLPDQATLSDIMYELYVRQKIGAGLKAAEDGRTYSHDEVRRRLSKRAD